MKKVIDFNHISSKLSEKEFEKLKKLYLYYHKMYTCYKWKYNKLKKIKLSLNMGSLFLVSAAGIACSITVNLIVIATLSGLGALVQGYMVRSKINNNLEMCKFAYTSYEKILMDIRSYLRGLTYDEVIFLSNIKVIDDIIIDNCTTIDGMVSKYNKKYKDLSVICKLSIRLSVSYLLR